jgi:phospholipid/cholesterol/gamma-HCH transport system ATP-binding protein
MIRLSQVTKSFGPKPVLRGIDLEIGTGESLVVIGGSGTGKSVLLKCVLGLVKPDGGTIELDGTDVTKGDRDAFLARFGMLFQGGALFDSMPVWQNVAFRLLRGEARNPGPKRARSPSGSCGAWVSTPTWRTSTRPSCRAACRNARALRAPSPPSPTSSSSTNPPPGLDPIMSGVINALIREIVTEMGVTAVTITHDMTSVRTIADKVAMLHAGKIRWHGPVAEMDAADDPYLRQFITGSAEGPIETLR